MEALGLDLMWFLFQLGNFLVLLAGLTWLLHKPVLKLLDERRRETEEGLRNAEEAKMQLASAEARQRAMLEETRREGTALMAETKRRAEELDRTLRIDAEIRAQRLRQDLEDSLASEREELVRSLKKELAGMVVEATEKALGETEPSRKKASAARNLETL